MSIVLASDLFSGQFSLFNPTVARESSRLEPQAPSSDCSVECEPAAPIAKSGSPELLAPCYLDPGTKAGLLLPNGDYLLDRRKIHGSGQTFINTAQAVEFLCAQEPMTVCIEWADLSSGQGITHELVANLLKHGHKVRTRSTRDAEKGRADTCNSGHGEKEGKCKDCTRRDLDAMALAGPKAFYEYIAQRRLSREKMQSAKVANNPGSQQLAELIKAKESGYVEYLNVIKPQWMKDISFILACQIYITAVVAKECGFGVRRFRRLLGNHQHARRCKTYSDKWRSCSKDPEEPSKLDPAKYDAAALRIFKDIRDGKL